MLRKGVLGVGLSLATAASMLMPASAAPARAAAQATASDDRVVWLCRPGLPDNPCEIPLDTTLQRSEGAGKVIEPARPAQRRRPVDCFYVYPTVSNQPTPTADKSKDPELRSIAKYQASRFSQHCRVFAPVYRQVTMAGLPIALTGSGMDVGYADVVQAWKEYLETYNKGRGVILIGHSQGTFMLRRLIAEHVDTRRDVRDRLVGAFLMGGNVTVAEGRTTGGDFQKVPLCTESGQYGCVVAYSTYASDPTPASFFSNNGTAEEGMEVACTDPNVLAGRDGPIGVTIPSEPFAPGSIAVGIVVTNGGPPPTAESTWVRPPDRYVGSCQEINDVHVFRYDPVAGSRRPNEFPPTWGTHILDVNLGLDERLVRIAGLQVESWLAAH